MTPIQHALTVIAALLLACIFADYARSASRLGDAKLQRCMVYLPAMKDAKLRRWCLAQSRRLP